MKITQPLSKQKSANKFKSKVKTGGKVRRPLWQRITAAVLIFVLLGTVGSFGYVKWKESDLKAKAAAFRFPDSSKRGDKRYNFALCYRNVRYLYGWMEQREIVGIATRPSGSFFFDGTRLRAKANPNYANREIGSNYYWFKSGGTDMTFVTGWASPSNLVSIWSYATENLGGVNNNREIEGYTVDVYVSYIPKC